MNFGQGGPNTVIDSLAAELHRAKTGARWLRVLVLATLCGLASSRCARAADEIGVRLHIAWGGGEHRQWQGRIVLPAGQISDLKLLGIDPDQPGSIQLSGQQILIRQKQPRSYDGFEASVKAAADTTIRIELLASGDLRAQVIEVPLSELVNGYRSELLDEQGNRLVVRRSPADFIRVSVPRDHLIYSPGESLRCTVDGHRLSADPGTTLRCRMELNSTSSRGPVWQQDLLKSCDATGSWPNPEQLSITLPDEEGVYSLDIVLSIRRRAPSFTPDKIVARRNVQLVVLADQSPEPQDDEGDRRLVLGIDPTQANWIQRMSRLPQWSLLPGFRTDGPLGNVKAERIERGGRDWTRLPVGGWQAYPLPVDKVGRPHELELEFAGDIEQSFSASIIEPNAAGKVIPIGLDSGVVTSSHANNSIAVRSPDVLRHRLIFWPKTKSPLLLVTNLNEHHDAIYGRLNVFSRSLPSVSALEDRHRMAVAFFERPLFPRAHGATESLDDETGRSLEDWQTFLDGARRLVQYAKYVGYDALAVTCSSEGSTLYPSRLLQPTPKHDRGIFRGAAQDPLRKDVMELLFRLCDREGLQLMPVVEFATPLPELEAHLLQLGQAEGITLVDATQATWLQRFQRPRGRAAYYNPLDERVQQAMLNVVDEVLMRYSPHPSFAGLTINMHADGYTQLPDVEWGMDSRTWNRFRREQQIRLAHPDQLDPSTRGAWLTWRCEQIGKFYADVAQKLTHYRADARLYLAASRLIDSRPIQRAFRPALPPQGDLDTAMKELGLAHSILSAVPNLVLLRPHMFVPDGAPLASPATADFNASQAVDTFFRNETFTGTQFLHHPKLMRLPSFDEVSPFGKSNTFLSLVAHLSPAGLSNRRRFAHALAEDDVQIVFEGGWMMPMGQDENVRDFLQVYRQLPQAAFETPDSEEQPWQPLTVRTYSTDDASYVYIVNDSPWYIGASATLTGAVGAQLESLRSQHQQPIQLESGNATWDLSLAPYDIAAIRADRAGIGVANVTVNLPPDVKPALENQMRLLGMRAAQLGNPSPMAGPENRGFDDWDASNGQPLNWTAQGRRDVVSIESENVHGGDAAMRIQLPHGSLSLRSAPLEVPESGRLSVSIWARVSDENEQPRVRLVLDVDGRIYHPWSPIGVGDSDRAIGQEWKEYVFRVSQLPRVNESLKIGIEVAGSGEVFLDDLRLYDVLLLDAAEHKALAHLLSGADIQRQMGMVSNCLRVLDGYWPKYLIDNVSEDVTEVADSPRPAKARASDTKPPKREASMWNRLRNFVPLR